MDIRKKVIAWAGAALLVAAGTVSVAAIANPAGPADNAPATLIQEQPAVVDLEPEAPEETPEPVAPVPAPEPAPVVEAPAPPPPPIVKCPAGTRANAVDGAGNESNCMPLTPQGEQCVAYDDNNNCTAWMRI